MPDPIHVSLHIYGTFPNSAFVDWIIARATRLSLCGWVQIHDSQYIELQVQGERILVEAMEVACTLGPIEAQVDSIKTLNIDPTSVISRQSGEFVEYSGLKPR